MAAVFTIDVQSENSFDAHCNVVMYLVHMNLSRRIIVKFPDYARDNTIACRHSSSCGIFKLHELLRITKITS